MQHQSLPIGPDIRTKKLRSPTKAIGYATDKNRVIKASFIFDRSHRHGGMDERIRIQVCLYKVGAKKK